jgi:hypothetical protein
MVAFAAERRLVGCKMQIDYATASTGCGRRDWKRKFRGSTKKSGQRLADCHNLGIVYDGDSRSRGKLEGCSAFQTQRPGLGDDPWNRSR